MVPFNPIHPIPAIPRFPDARGVSVVLAGLLLALLGGCGDPAGDEATDLALPPETEVRDERPPAPSPEGAAPVTGADHLRVLAFVSLARDSSTVVPWSFRSTITEGGIRRVRELALARNGTWEALHADTLMTPLTRFPWRILPGGPVRMVVGFGDLLESLAFEDPPRALELVPGEFLAEWVPEAGVAWRIHRGRLELPAGRVEGILLDLNRSRGPGSDPSLDWIFLHDGAGTQILLREPPGPADDEARTTPREEAPWLAWSRVAFQERSWSDVRVRWSAVRAMEAARRDVPVAWSLEVVRPGAGDAPGSTPFSGEIRVVSSFLQVEEGPGPLLPVSGYLEVEGEVEVLGERIAVRGVARHRQR